MTADGIVLCTMHIRGLSLQSRFIDPLVNAERMEEFAEALLSNRQECISIPQFHLSVFNGERHVETRYASKRLKCPDTNKRVVLQHSLKNIVQTMPYGYTADLMNNTCLLFKCDIVI